MFQSQRKCVSMKYESKHKIQCFCWFCVLDAVHAYNITILVDNTWYVDNTATEFHQQGNNISLQFKLVISCRWSFKYNASILVNNKSCWIFHTNCPSLIGLWGKNYIVLQCKKASTWNIVQNSELIYICRYLSARWSWKDQGRGGQRSWLPVVWEMLGLFYWSLDAGNKETED